MSISATTPLAAVGHNCGLPRRASTALAPTITLSDAERSSLAFAIDLLDDRAYALRDRGVPESVSRVYSDLAERLHEDLEGRSTVALTTRTYLALQTAADLVRERLALRESLPPKYADPDLDAGDPGEYAGAADDLQAIHDRHHRAVVIEADGQPHGDSCSWCSNAADANEPVEPTSIVDGLVNVRHDAPSSADVIASLSVRDGNQGCKTVLATVEHGPYTAQITRWDELADDGTAIPGRPQIEMDSADQEGLDMLHDFVVLGHQTADFFAFIRICESVVGQFLSRA